MTMNKTIKSLLLIAGLLAATSGFAQTILGTTTLSAAVQGVGSVNGATPTGNLAIVTVASATGISAPSANTSLTSGLPATSEAQTYIYIDRELMQVKAVSSTTLTVIRGVGSTAETSHASGALVFVLPVSAVLLWTGGNYGVPPAVPGGSCTRANETYLPRIQFISGIISDCNGGQWVNGDALQTTRSAGQVQAPQTAATALTSIDTAGNAPGAVTEQYCTQVNMPFSKLLNGISLLNGTTVGTDKRIYILYDSSGNLLANTATAGTTTSGASTYQNINFVTPYYAVGPATYFACFQQNGTTDTYRRIVAAVNDTLNGGKLTGQTFGTVPNPITVPSTFTAALAGYWAF